MDDLKYGPHMDTVAQQAVLLCILVYTIQYKILVVIPHNYSALYQVPKLIASIVVISFSVHLNIHSMYLVIYRFTII